MTKKILTLSLLSLIFFSCKENNAENSAEIVKEPTVETPVSDENITVKDTLTTSTEAAVEVKTETTPVNAGPFTQPQQTTQQPATTGTTAPGFSGKPNPPHGQPGHRCDIKVGDILP